MRSLRPFFAVATGLIVIAVPIFAHHGNAEYDEKRPLTQKGTVTEFMWASPHSKIVLDAKNANGSVVHWSIETLSPGKLARAGWTKDAVKPGDQITVTFSPAKNGSAPGFLTKLLILAGTQLGML